MSWAQECLNCERNIGMMMMLKIYGALRTLGMRERNIKKHKETYEWANAMSVRIGKRYERTNGIFTMTPSLTIDF